MQDLHVHIIEYKKVQAMFCYLSCRLFMTPLEKDQPIAPTPVALSLTPSHSTRET